MTSSQLEKRLNILQYVIVTLLIAVIVVPFALGWWIATQLPVVNSVDIENMQIVGEPAFCPGQPLVISYDFHATGAGLLVRDSTLWNIDPPRTLIYSASRRFVLDGPVDQHLTETWHVPATYLDFQTETVVTLPPGKYRRFMAISSPSRSSVIDIDHVDFEIKQGCN